MSQQISNRNKLVTIDQDLQLFINQMRKETSLYSLIYLNANDDLCMEEKSNLFWHMIFRF